jgi:hypothetical protein
LVVVALAGVALDEPLPDFAHNAVVEQRAATTRKVRMFFCTA